MRGNVIDKDGHDARQKPAEKETEQRFANQKTAKSDADALLHELQVHQIELEMQNDELRAVEQQLQKSQQEYADLFESAPVGYLILDTKARIIKINRMGLDILKQPIEKINGRPLSMYIDTADLAVFMAHKKVVLDNGLRQGCELRLVKADNTTISAYLISEPVKDKAGKIIQCRTSITDLTQTKDEQRYHAIADYTYDWESWVDPDGRLLWVNPAVERLTGYTIKEYQNLPDRLKQVLFEEDLEMCRAHYERGFRQRLSGNDIEFRIRHKNGSLRWAAMSYQPIYANNGDFLGMRSSIRDINDRKQAEEAARTNKERFRQVFDNISSGMAVYEAVDNGEDFIIREFNPAAERITNLQRSKVLGCRVSQVFPTVTIFGLFKVFQRVWHNGIPECHPANMYHDDRLEFWAENYVFKLPTGEVVAIFDDITDRKQAEEAMRESKAELERINNDLVQTAIQIKTLMNDVVAKNDFTGKFFSQSLPPCWEVKKCGNTACPSYRNHANLRCWEVAGTFCCGKVQGKVAQKLGDCQLCEVYQNARANPIMDLGETFNDMITVLKDRYEEIQKINENLEIANQQLTEHDRLKNEFVDTVTHELRTPLCIFKNIISNALVGAMGEVSPKLKGNLTVADQEICRLGKIISDFVDIAEIDRGIITLRTKRFALQSAVANTIKSLTPLAAAKNIRLTVVAPDSELLLDADYNRLVQVLTNLLGNAIKFTPAGGQVVIRLKDIEDDIFVEVEDNGVGVAADDISKVFSRFVQIEKQVGAGEHGIGLGLSITKALIEMHGGHIWAESTPGQGSVFCFTLPKHAKTSAQSVEIPATEQNHIAS